MPTLPPSRHRETPHPVKPGGQSAGKPRIGCWMLVMMLVLIGLFVAWRVWWGINLAMDIKAVQAGMGRSSGPGGPNVSRLAVPLVDGLGRAPGVSQDPFGAVNIDWSNAWPPDGRRLPHADLETAVRVAISDLGQFEGKLASRIGAALASPPATPVNRLPYTFGPAPDFRGSRETVRLWLAVSRIQAARGDRAHALQTVLGIVLAANAIEATEPEGCSLICHMIGTAVRNLAAIGLLELAADGGVGRRDATEALATVVELDRSAVSIGTVLAFERDLPISVGMLLEDKIAAGKAVAEYGRNPTTLAALLRPTSLRPKIEALWGPIEQLASMPYPQAQAALNAFGSKAEEMQKRVGTIGLHYLGYVVNPEDFVFDLMMSIMAPNVRKALESSVQARVRLRGAVIALLATAYHLEAGHWPTSLTELERVAGGTPLPTDLFSNAAFGYSVSGGVPKLVSAGKDGKPGTADDLVFLPISTKPAAAAAANPTEP